MSAKGYKHVRQKDHNWYDSSRSFVTGCSGMSAADRAGVAERVQNDAFQSTRGLGLPVKMHDEVFQNAEVYTKQYGTMDVMLDDGTSLTVAPNSSITIDEYVYAGQQSAG